MTTLEKALDKVPIKLLILVGIGIGGFSAWLAWKQHREKRSGSPPNSAAPQTAPPGQPPLQGAAIRPESVGMQEMGGAETVNMPTPWPSPARRTSGIR